MKRTSTIVKNVSFLNNIILDYTGTVVSMIEPKQKSLYWGYIVRIAENLSQVFNESVYDVCLK